MLYRQEQVQKVIATKDLSLAEELSALAKFQGTRGFLCNGDLCLDCQNTASYDWPLSNCGRRGREYG